MVKIDNISNIVAGTSDDMFITCASFEERCLGTINRFDNYSTNRIVLFVFKEPNHVREKHVAEMDKVFQRLDIGGRYKKISVEHGISTSGILQLHKFYKSEKLLGLSDLSISIGITTFTKELLFEVLFYLVNILKVKQLRLLYTVPERYASPDEGLLSYGIKSIKVMPFFWNRWSSIKDDLLIVILGYEEMRAWALISQFDANENILLITNPGSKPGWDKHCEIYNKRLLEENFAVQKIPSMKPFETAKIFEELVLKKRLYENYNIFIAPLGTKPQIAGVFHFVCKHPEAMVNIVSTTAVEHNSPYYSSGIGETFYTTIEY